MNEITARIKLSSPPTAVCKEFGRLYVATKNKRVYCAKDDATLRSIRFSHCVNTLTSNGQILFCGQTDGSLFGLNEKHKSEFKVAVGDTKCIQSQYDRNADDLLVGSENRKILVFGKEEMLKNSYFINNTPLADFDLQNSLLAAISQIDQSINVIDLRSKEKDTIKHTDGFPEVVKFIRDDIIVVGSTSGTVSCFSTANRKRICYLKMEGPVSALHVLSSELLLVGTKGKIALVGFSNFNTLAKIEEVEVEGIPVAFDGKKEVYCALSRESRLERWLKCKDGKNLVVKLNIN